MDHHHYASPMISPTAHFALNTAVRGKGISLILSGFIWPKHTDKFLWFSSKKPIKGYCLYSVMADLFLDKNITSEKLYLWPKMLER